jgi:hypothetical protein
VAGGLRRTHSSHEEAEGSEEDTEGRVGARDRTAWLGNLPEHRGDCRRPPLETPDGRQKTPGANSDIEIADVEGVLFDEVAAGFDVVAHQNAENLVGAGRVCHGHLE